MEKNNKKYRLLVIIILSTVFGLSAGIVGDLIARVYILESTFNIPFYGEINFSNGKYQGSNIIIREAKKVVVEQNDKVADTINSAKSSLVGIYKRNLSTDFAKKIAGSEKEFDLGNFYKLGQEVAQGLIITSDGWIITNFLPEQTGKPTDLNYVVITQDKKIYSIDKVVSDTLTPFYFLHVSAKDLSVRRFAEMGDINNGQLVLAINWNGEAKLNSIINKKDVSDGFLFFSDSFSDEIKLADSLGKEFSGSFLFNLSGDIVGLSDKNGKVEPISHFTGAIESLLKNKVVKRPSLGVNYIDLSKIVSALPENNSQSEYRKGALIYKSTKGISIVKGSTAEEAGLKEGDIISSVEGIEINNENNLNDIILQFTANDNVSIVYLRNGVEKEVEIKLGELK